MAQTDGATCCPGPFGAHSRVICHGLGKQVKGQLSSHGPREAGSGLEQALRGHQL